MPASMNSEAQEYLNEILRLEPHELTKAQRDFLRARRAYLKTYEKEQYAQILDSKEKATPPGEVSENDQPDLRPQSPFEPVKTEEELAQIDAELKNESIEEKKKAAKEKK